MTKERIVELDILKCIGIVMVVTGHTKCPLLLDAMIYFIHMPLFFYLSGVTNRGDGYYASAVNLKEFFVKRVKSLYIPFLKFALAISLLHNAFYAVGLYAREYDIAQYGIQIVRTLLFSVGETEPFLPQLWFIKVLFIAEMFYAVIVYLCQKYGIDKWYVILPLCLVFFLMPVDWFPHVMCTNFILPVRALLFYAIGSLHSRIIGSRYNSMPIMMAGIAIWVIASMYYGHIGINGVWGMSAIILMCLIFITVPLLFSFSSWVKKYRVSSLLVGGGKSCIHIYFWHYVIFKFTSAITVWTIWPSAENLERIRRSHFIEDISWCQYVVIAFMVMGIWVILARILHERVCKAAERN